MNTFFLKPETFFCGFCLFVFVGQAQLHSSIWACILLNFNWLKCLNVRKVVKRVRCYLPTFFLFCCFLWFYTNGGYSWVKNFSMIKSFFWYCTVYSPSGKYFCIRNTNEYLSRHNDFSNDNNFIILGDFSPIFSFQ